MKTSAIQMLAEGKMSKTLFRLCLPAVAAMAVNGIYNVVDAFFIGLTGDMGAIGAISVIFPLFVVITALGIFLGIGASSYISRCLGAKAILKANDAASTAVIFSLILGAVSTVTGFLLMRPMLYLFGAREVIMPYASAYTSWILYGNIFAVLNVTLAGIIRAEGNTIYPTVAMLSGTVLNIALDPVFIFAAGLGIKGAAIATLISYITTSIISIYYYLSNKAVIKIRLRLASISKENSVEIIKVGFPAMTKQVLLAVVFCMINMLSAGYGENAVTAAGICAKVNSFMAMTMMGITQGFMPVAGFNFGAKNYARVLDAFKKILFVLLLFAVICSLLYLLLSDELIRIFCRDEAVIRIGEQFMIAFAVGTIPLAVSFLMDALFFACGLARAAMLLSISRQGLIFIPLVLIADRLYQLQGVIWSSAAADTLSSILIALPLFIAFIHRIKSANASLNISIS